MNVPSVNPESPAVVADVSGSSEGTATADSIADAAREHGMRTMYEDGLVKSLAGVTTIEEVLRVTQES